MWLWGWIGGERGQSATEYLGMVVVIAAIVGVIARSDVDRLITDGVRDQVCNVLGDSCADKDDKAPKLRDTDDDGLSDREERRRGTRPGRADTDYDDISDGEEIERGTSPLRQDTDNDGVPDGEEIKNETDPRDKNDRPAPGDTGTDGEDPPGDDGEGGGEDGPGPGDDGEEPPGPGGDEDRPGDGGGEDRPGPGGDEGRPGGGGGGPASVRGQSPGGGLPLAAGGAPGAGREGPGAAAPGAGGLPGGLLGALLPWGSGESSDEGPDGIPPPPQPPPAGGGAVGGGDGSGEFDSENPGFAGDVKNRAVDQAATRGADAFETIGLQDAARHMRHFLGGSGEPLEVEPERMLRDIEDFRTNAEAERTRLVRDAQSTAARRYAGKPFSFELRDREWTAGADSDRNDLGDNWFYALGEFSFTHTARAEVSPPKEDGGRPEVRVDYQLHVFDRYNWDKDAGVDIGPLHVSDEELQKLHRAGLARDYEVMGSSPPASVTVPAEADQGSGEPTPPSSSRKGDREDPGRERGRDGR